MREIEVLIRKNLRTAFLGVKKYFFKRVLNLTGLNR